MRADDLDGERLERPTKVGHAIALGRGGVVAEHRVLVRVERHRLTVRLDILPGRVHVGKGALALDHLQMHQLAGRIIDVNQQRALRPAILKPPVLRAIELDQLAAAVPAVTRLIGPWAASIAVLPESFLDHPLAQRLVRNGDLVPLGQILDRQGRTEIMVVLADKAENLIAQLRFECTVARAAALPGYKRLGTVRTQSVEQTVDQAPTDDAQPSGLFDTKLTELQKAHRREHTC